MKTPSPPRGLRILIVEDEEAPAQLLAFTLSKAFPKTDILSAGTVAEGHARLDEAQSQLRPFDVAILDFKLPLKPGTHPESDFSLGRSFRDLSPETIITHVTAHKEDTEIRRFLNRRDTLVEAGRIFVAKETGWMQKVIEEITRSIHTRRIRQGFNDLFRRESSSTLQRSHGRRHATGRSDRLRTLQVATLCTDAGRHWEFLSDSLKKDLERVLGHAQDKQGNHYVGVAESPPELREEDVEI